MRNLVAAMLVLIACAWGAESARAATVTGKMTIEQGRKTVAGVQLLAYPSSSPSLAGQAPIVSVPTKEDGQFSLDLPAGEYFFFARGAGLFSYYGRNPVTVAEDGLAAMNLALVAEQPPGTEVQPRVDTGVIGVARVEGKPLSGVIVYVYTDLNDRLKGMGIGMSAPTDERGMFEFPLPPGTYYLLARQRQSGGFAGPLRSGDYVGYYPANPLVVHEGEAVKIAIPMLEVPAKVDRLAARLFGQTSIQGRILDAKGQPVAGVWAILYGDPMMLNRPLYVSQPSGADGAFVLSFPHGGTYYLAARNQLGGTPQPGELYGRYAGSPDSSLQVAVGQAREGIDIVVEEMW
ncbi:MAG: hypothetical protein A2X84_11695 [Desulfuromonadaceae bacterium GWC2_58_13]|nr:MAG: hypothetical protein A2X84_11695 [Desulfuromonadaceae bacterium GWC2_58_13]